MKKLVVGGWWLVLGALCLLPGAAWAETQSVSYWDSKENVMKTNDCERITADTWQMKKGKWYYVEGEVKLSHSLSIESDDMHLILKDGANLVIHASKDSAGILVCYESNIFLKSDSLYVYGQEKGTGRMEVHGGENAAGIGGTCNDSANRHMGNMYVHGGIIEAYGGKNAAGIGGSYYKDGNTVYAGDGAMDFFIYGGTVRAYGGEGAAGVGGANGDADPSDLELYGGSLEATGGKNGGKGIGGGAGKGAKCELESKYAAVWTDPSPSSAFSIVDDDYDCTTSYVRMIAIHELVTGDTATFKRGKGYLVNSSVSRGTISVDGSAYLFLGKNSELTVHGDSAPGWYYKMAGLQVTSGNSIEIFGLEGGKLTASGGYAAAGIGGGDGGAGGTVTINSGTVTATSSGSGAGIGGGQSGAGGTVTINGGTVTATGASEEGNGGGAGIGGGSWGYGNTVTINGGTVTAKGAGGGKGIGGGRSRNGGSVAIYGGTVRAEGSDAFGQTVTLGECVFAYDVTGGEPGTLIENKDGLTSVDKILAVHKIPTCEDGEIVKVDDTWVVTPNTDVEAVTIENLPTGAKLALKLNGYTVSSAAFIGFGDKTEGVFSLALNPKGEVNGVRVTPTIGEGVDNPFVVGEGSVEVAVKSIAGLKYTLKRTDSLRRAEDVAPYQDWGEAGEPVIATGPTVTLEDPNPPADKAFYRVEVSAP